MTAIVALTILTRLPALLHPRPIDDEAVYAVVANEIVDGGRAYVDAVERKPPLLFWTYAAVFELAGKFNWPALHVVAVLWTLFTMAGLYVIARRLFDRDAGLVAALLYSIFQPWGTWKNLALNGELLMNLPLVWAWAAALRPVEDRRVSELIVAGGLVGAGFLLKQPAAIATVPIALYLLLPRRSNARHDRMGGGFGHAALFTLGFVATLGAVAVLLRAQGTLAEAFHWTIVDHDVPQIFWQRAVLHTAAFVVSCLPLLLAARVGLGAPEIWEARRRERLAIAVWLAVSCVGAAAAGRFYPHYYIQLLPPLVLLAAPVYVAIGRRATPAPAWCFQPHVARAWLMITVIVFAALHGIGLAPRRGATEAGRYILEHSLPTDRIFVWGHAAIIYLDAERRPASRYIMTFPLTGYIFGQTPPGIDTRHRIVPGAWEDLEQDFADHAPRYIIDTEIGTAAPYPLAHFPRLARFVATQYRPVARTREAVIYERIEAHAFFPPLSPPTTRTVHAFTKLTLNSQGLFSPEVSHNATRPS